MGPSQDKRFIGELAISLPWAHSALTPFNELMAGPVRVHHGFMRIMCLGTHGFTNTFGILWRAHDQFSAKDDGPIATSYLLPRALWQGISELILN
jgi:hypothetical protein